MAEVEVVEAVEVEIVVEEVVVVEVAVVLEVLRPCHVHIILSKSLYSGTAVTVPLIYSNLQSVT
jgi:hypothetical protein